MSIVSLIALIFLWTLKQQKKSFNKTIFQDMDEIEENCSNDAE